MDKTIELDCAPFTPRPDTYIGGVIKDTGLPAREPTSQLFGNWVWDYNDFSDEFWLAIQPVIKDRVIALYNQGAIRYGSW